MSTNSSLLLFVLAALATVATPGPTVLLALANGSRHGLLRAGAGVLGAMLSDLLLVVAVAGGLGALLMASEVAFAAVKWLGVAYLAWLGIRLLRGRGRRAAGPVPDGGARSLFVKSLLVAVTNPKAYLFFAALLPQFVDPLAPQLPQYATLGAVFALIDGVVMAGYAALGARAARMLAGPGLRTVDRGCGAVMLLLAAVLAGQRRLPA